MPHRHASIASRSTNTKRRRIAAAGLILAVLSCCQDDLSRYYPLEAGLAWHYRVTLTQGREVTTTTADVVNLQPTDVLGRTGVPQQSEMFGQSLVRYLAKDERGIFEFAQQQAGGGVTPVGNDTPNYVLRVPLAHGTTWPSTWQSTRDGRRMSFPTVKAIAATDETVMVPAGTFSDCIRLKITGKGQANLASGPATIEVQGDEWYAPEIGFIKGIFRETVNSGEAPVEQEMDLASFATPR
jgi:hypothetical protein